MRAPCLGHGVGATAWPNQCTHLYASLSRRPSLAAGADPLLDLEIGVDGWPRWLSLAPQLAAAMAAPPGRPVGHSTAPPVYLSMLYIRNLPADHAAQLLAWSDQYHVILVPPSAAAGRAAPQVARMLSSGLWASTRAR